MIGRSPIFGRASRKRASRPSASASGAFTIAWPGRGSRPLGLAAARAFVAPVSPTTRHPRPVDTTARQIVHRMPASVQPALQQGTQQQPALASEVTQPQPYVITLEPGFAVTIQLTEKLSTDYSNSGDTFRGMLDEPLIANGFVIAEKGWTAVGRIEYARRARLFGGESELVLTLTEIGTGSCCEAR